MTEEALLCKMKFICDKQWADLKKIEGEPKIRYCRGCDKNVYWCADNTELALHRGKEHCVAFMVENADIPASEFPIIMGEILMPDYKLTKP